MVPQNMLVFGAQASASGSLYNFNNINSITHGNDEIPSGQTLHLDYKVDIKVDVVAS